jgi:hypothetical protein
MDRGNAMTTREKELIALFKVDRDYCAQARQADDARVAAVDTRAGFKFCVECGRRFILKHAAEKYCSQSCRDAPEKRRYRTRVGI